MPSSTGLGAVLGMVLGANANEGWVLEILVGPCDSLGIILG